MSDDINLDNWNHFFEHKDFFVNEFGEKLIPSQVWDSMKIGVSELSKKHDKLEQQLKEANKVIEEQAIEIQKLNTENELLKSELNWESECKFAYKSKRDELKLDFDKLCIRYNEVHNYNREKRTLLKEAYQIIECLYNLDTLDSEIDKSWIDEAFRNASMFLQNNTEYKAV